MEQNQNPVETQHPTAPVQYVLPTDDGLKHLGHVLHDLCQPLTTMQCRLEMAQMLGTEADYRDSVAIALNECERMNECVHRLRAALRLLMADELPSGAL